MLEASIEDLRTMFKNSIILFNKEPFLVEDVVEGKKFLMKNIATEEMLGVVPKDEEISSAAFRLGYINLGRNCAYIFRRPLRRWKVGICLENVAVINSQEHRINREEERTLQHLLRNGGISLYNTIVGNYPELEEATKRAEDIEGIVAFDRQFAISDNKNIFYKGTEVGSLVEEQIKFNKGFEFLKFAL